MKNFDAHVIAAKEEVQRKLELEKTMQILSQACLPSSILWLIKRVFTESSNNGARPVWGAMNVYELGRQAGIREERSKRKLRRCG